MQKLHQAMVDQPVKIKEDEGEREREGRKMREREAEWVCEGGSEALAEEERRWYYCKEWLDMAHNRCPPHKDIDITREWKKCIDRFFSNEVSNGASTPKLQIIALKLLGHSSSSSCCERNWSTYNFIHSIKRNKITPERAEDLIFVHSNLHQLSRKMPEYKEGETHMWDVGGDAFDSMDLENTEVLEIANLSLDEPDLKAIIFTHDE
ncbi:hypothetical protein L3X38_031487 [Prunus dulcis]|uniref:HAT C-terminal dimerisation domain-containing protein n=1 Tax=Prunus dulcis TaxID=3755 RepID=A0AAD4VCA6_PRUDU|nr:hypothetical protein L3X38_031487 [Prunus dulcis]